MKRSGKEHKKVGFELLNCRTLEEVKSMESNTGARYSELFRLSYFDPIIIIIIIIIIDEFYVVSGSIPKAGSSPQLDALVASMPRISILCLT